MILNYRINIVLLFSVLFFLSAINIYHIFPQEKRLSIYEQTILYSFDSLSEFELEPQGKIYTSIENFFPAPRSDAFLSIRAYTIENEKISVQFKNPKPVKDYIEEISIWVYGFYQPISGYLTLKDNIHKKFYIPLGTMKFRGWKKITVGLPEGFFQEDFYLNEKKPVFITGISFIPFSEKRMKKSFLIWIDEMSILHRKRYLLPEKF